MAFTPSQDEPSSTRPGKTSASARPGMKRFFTRGLAILLPTVITIGLVAWAYNFVDGTIAEPINRLIRYSIVSFSDFPEATDQDYDDVFNAIDASDKRAWENIDDDARTTAEQYSIPYTARQSLANQRWWMSQKPEIRRLARRNAVERHWNQVRVGAWVLADLIGLVVAVLLILFIGVILSNLVGRKLYAKGEEIINRLPLIRKVYPSVKQVTDFFFGEKDQTIEFNRVVAVQYPRKGLWSVGLVTGATMQAIQDAAGAECLTVFVPSSPTPFTGYVITVPIHDTIDLPVTIEEALKFAVSGGVLIPPNQEIVPSVKAAPQDATELPPSDRPANPAELTTSRT